MSLEVIQTMRNPHNAFGWLDLRAALAVLHTTLLAVKEPAAKVQIVVDAVARGDRLRSVFTDKQIMSMFTNMLQQAHGVDNAVYTADVARLRKAAGLGVGSGLPLTQLTAPFQPASAAMGAITALPNMGSLAIGSATPATQPRAKGRRRGGGGSVTLPISQPAGTGHYTPATASPAPPHGYGGGGRGGGGGQARGGTRRAPPPGMSASQYQMVRDVRNQRNTALQQQQVATPGNPHGGERCHKCATAGRDPHHDHQRCAFWTCSKCKEAGHRVAQCTNPFAP